MNVLKKKVYRSEFYVLLIIIILSVIIEVKSGLFFTSNNLVDLMRSIIVNGIFAVVALLSFISTGPDVSFPLIAALSSYLAVQWGVTNNHDGSIVVPFLIAMAAGFVLGAINGIIISIYRFPSLIVTLATSSIYSGILFGYFEAERMDLPESLHRFGRMNLLTVTDSKSGLGSSLPYTFIFLVLIYLLAYIVLDKTTMGRGVYAVGGDEVAATRAGFNVKKYRFWIFSINGVLAAIAGLCYTVMSQKLLPTEFAGGEMIVIAAIVLGGTRLTGGVGTLFGCLVGTVLLSMVSNSLIMLGIPITWQKVFIGSIIIIGTAISMTKSKAKKAQVQNEEC